MIDLEQIERFYVPADGFPRPQWDEIFAQIDALAKDERDGAWELVFHTWLSKLAHAVSDEANVFLGDGLALLASSSSDCGEDLLAYSVRTRARIRKLLSGLCKPEDEYTLVVLVFADIEQFYDYIAYFYTEDGEYGGAGGMFINSYYPHVVVGPGGQWARHTIIAHELTHNYLHGQDLPVWLEEGLCQAVEESSVGNPLFHLDHEMKHRHESFWSEHGLEEFWSGAGFQKPGDIQELSYQLALILFRSIRADYRKQVVEFVRQAQWQDAGESAAAQVLGIDLAELAAGFLGQGDWSPRGAQ